MTLVTNACQEFAKQGATRTNTRQAAGLRDPFRLRQDSQMGQPGRQTMWPDLEEFPVLSHD